MRIFFGLMKLMVRACFVLTVLSFKLLLLILDLIFRKMVLWGEEWAETRRTGSWWGTPHQKPQSMNHKPKGSRSWKKPR